MYTLLTRITALIAVLLPSLAIAQGQQRSKYAGVLDPIDWGATPEAVFGKIKGELDASYKDQLKTSDSIKIDRLMRQKADEVQRVRDSLLRFDGGQTGYESSLLANEVLPGQNEALVRVDDRRGQRYFVFRDDRLWKVVVTYNVSSIGTFPQFLDQIRGKYGAPKKVSFSDEGGERRMKTALWEDEHTRMVAEDHSDFYSSYVIKYIQVGEGTRLEEARNAAPRDRRSAGEARAEGLMADIFEEDRGGASDDLVDQITGVEATVDLESGRPATYAPPPMAEDDEPTKKKPAQRGKKPAGKKDPPKKPAEPAIIF